MKTYQEYQQNLLENIKSIDNRTIPKAIEAAYLSTPRHFFIDKFLDHNEKDGFRKITQTEANLTQYLPILYSNNPIGLAADDEGTVLSTISQPSAVLMMLKKMDLKPGQKVLEIGTASGWNAALISKLVGSEGEVHSIEIISDLAVRAKAKMKKYNLSNVYTYDGDGATANYKEKFDRIMFTVGAYDVPSIIFDQLKDNGLLFMVVKSRGLFDDLILLRRKGDYLVSIENIPSRFVPLKGEYAMPDLDTILLESLPIWEKLKPNNTREQSFWFGIISRTPRTNLIKLAGITTFLGIVEPQFQLFKNEGDTISFGLIDEQQSSLVIWKNNKLIAYGNDFAFNQLKAKFQLYFDLGMPSSSCFQLKVYSIDVPIETTENQWLVKRKDSQFLWSLKV